MKLRLFLVAALVAITNASPAAAQTLQWARSLAGGGSDIVDLEVGNTGSVYITGYFLGTTDFNPGAGTANLTSVGGTDYFVARYDAAGNYLWARRIGGSDWESSGSLAVDGAGNVYVGGYFRGTISFDASATLTNGGDLGNPFIAKYDASGNLVWARGLLGSGNGYLRGLRLDGSGNVIVTGTLVGTLDLDPSSAATQNLTSSGDFNLFVAKYSPAGNLTWARMLDASNSIYYPSLAVEPGGDILIAASFAGSLDADPGSGTTWISGTPSASEPTSLFLGKYTSSGALVWARGVVGAENDPLGVGSGIAVDGSGNVIVTGYFTGTASFGAQTLTALGDWDVFVAKYSSTNAAQWAVQMGGAGAEVGSGVAVDTSGSIYVVGSYYDSGDYHPSPSSTATLTHLGAAGSSSDTFLAKLAPDGTYQWAHALNSSSDDHMKDATMDGSGNLYVSGFTHGTVDFDVGAGAATVSGSAAAKYSVSTTTSALIPVMTSGTTPSGSATSSGSYSSGYEAWRAFTDTFPSLWLSNMYTSSVWLAYEWGGGISKTVSSYEIRYNNGSCCEQRGPKSWTLEGWNGSSWVVVDTVTNQTGWYTNPLRTFAVDSPGSYTRYRLHVTADNYNHPSYPITLVSIESLQFY
ncbi:uncharacterized protein SOCE26_013670 [Sorangium cellulosum]|uniref:F5/8 type C domain-containing protein n=1 Tax=Sorangium cellulosum TaxID=56 RepID=A0A2L0EL17_SORCE|nr:SBBP repeat-containing protein [Sorangium cellulosum]AUX39972.1 uncharacterized protein SOCE26_013670 [Sorangium cellulosum]